MRSDLKQQANGLSVKQLAWMYGCTEDAMHTRLRRARASVRGAAIEEGFDGRHGGLCASTGSRPLDEDDESGRPFDVYQEAGGTRRGRGPKDDE